MLVLVVIILVELCRLENMYSDDDLNELVASSLRTAKGITELKDENFALRMALDEARSLKREREHPVDRLWDVREQLKELEMEEKHLKEEILKDHDFIGEDYEAKVKVLTRQNLDKFKLMERFPLDEVNKCYKASTYTVVNLYKK